MVLLNTFCSNRVWIRTLDSSLIHLKGKFLVIKLTREKNTILKVLVQPTKNVEIDKSDTVIEIDTNSSVVCVNFQ